MAKKTAEDVARETLENIKKGKAESKGAASADQAENKKTEGKEAEAKQAREKADAQAKLDEQILSDPEDKLDDNQKKRKAELVKVKENQEKKDKEKAALTKTAQEKVNERMGELTTEIKKLQSERNTDKDKVSLLERELGELKKAPAASDEDVKKQEAEGLKKADKARLEKYLDEDKDKPKEERREMSKDELDDWYLEDTSEAQAWVTERTIRRMRDKEKDKAVSVLKKEYKALYAKQDESAKKTHKAHPELDVVEREAALKKAGKTPQEIYDIIKGENPKWRICADVIKENPEFLGKPNGPELIVKEMEKRLAKEPQKSKKHSFSDEELEALKETAKKEAREEEKARQEEADGGTGLSSTRSRPPSEPEPDETSKEQQRIAQRAGISKERLADLKKRRTSIPGATVS